MKGKQFRIIKNKVISLLAASAILTTQIPTLNTVNAVYENNRSETKVRSSNLISELSVPTLNKGADANSITTTQVTTTSASVTTTDVERIKAEPVLSMDKLVVPSSAAGTKVNMNVYINDGCDSDDVTCSANGQICIDFDARISQTAKLVYPFENKKNARNIKLDYIISTKYRRTVSLKFTNSQGENSNYATLEFTIPNDVKPGDIFYFDICDTNNDTTNLTLNYADGNEKSIVSQIYDNSDDKYLKDTPYDGYILIDPNSEENNASTQRSYELFRNDYITYAEYNDHAEVAYCDYEVDNAVIKSEINGKKVTAIADEAFKYTNIKSITIPETITSIGYGAFMESSIESATIPESVKTWVDSIFRACTSLKKLNLPNGLEEIPERICYDCSALTEINIPSTVKKIGTCAFANTGLNDVVLPDSVTYLSNSAFADNKNLSSVKLSSNLHHIGLQAFSGCEILESLELPDSLSSIESSAFENTMITELNMPASIESCARDAFSGSNISSINYPEDAEKIPAYAYGGASKMESVNLPSKLKYIPEGAFNDCISLKSVDIPQTVERIEYGAFKYAGLKELSIPDSVKKIGEYAFENTNIEYVEIPDSVTELSYYAFKGSALKQVKLPSTLKILNSVFVDCHNLTSVEIPSSVTTMSGAAFQGCSSLKSITIPDSVTEIYGLYFTGCSSLTSIDFPESLKLAYGVVDFSGCSSLLSIDLPESMNEIREFKISYCSSLTSIDIPKSLKEISNSAFSGCSSLTSVDIPESVKYIDDYAFHKCYNLESVNLPETIFNIGVNAFAETKISSIYIPSGVLNIYRDALESGELKTIYGYKGSKAEAYAKSHNKNFIEVESRPVITTTVPKTTTTTTTLKPTTTSTTTTTTTTTSTLKTTTKPTTTSTTKITTKPSGGNAVTTKKTTTTTTTTSASMTTSIDTTTANTTSVPSTTIDTSTTTEPVPPAPHRLNIDGEMTVKEMNLEEIQKAGININDKDNCHVFKYEVKMKFEAHKITLSKYQQIPGEYFEPEVNYKEPIMGGIRSGKTVHTHVTVDGKEAPVLDYLETERDEMYLIVTGECKWLKEFYEVQLLVINKDDQGEELTNCFATLNVPDGLTLMNCTETQPLGTMIAGSAFTAHWYVRGDKAGDYELSAVFKGKNRGEEFSYDFKSKNNLHVYAGDALKMKITLPQYSFFDEDYTVKISFENVSDKPIYNLEHTILGYLQSKQVKKYKGNVLIEEGPVLPINSEDFSNMKYEVGQLDPGDTVVAIVTMKDMWKSIIELNSQDNPKIAMDLATLLSCTSKAPLLRGFNFLTTILHTYADNIVVAHILKCVDVAKLDGSTTEIPYEVELLDISPELRAKYSKNMLAEIAKSMVNWVVDQASDENKFKGRGDIYTNLASFGDDMNKPGVSADDVSYGYLCFLASILNDEGVTQNLLTLGHDVYYGIYIPEKSSSVTFYVRKADGTIHQYPHSIELNSRKNAAYEDFEIEVIDGEYTVDENGDIIFTSDAIIKVIPKKSGIKATIGAVSDDGNETFSIPVLTVDEHDCKGDTLILTPPSDGDGAASISFCETCGELLDCSFLPIEATAMLSNGECYDDIRGAIADAEKSEEELKLYIFGDINIVEDVTIPEDLMLVIVPDTMINVNNGCKLIAKGEVKDFSGYDYDLSGNGPISSKITTTSVTTTITTTTTSNSTTTTVVATPTADKRIVGSWYVSHVTIKTDSYDFTDDKGVVIFNNDFTVEAQSKITIGNDGKLHENNEYWTKNGTWSIKGDKYYATPSDIKETEFNYDEATDTISVRLTDAYLVMKRGGKITSTINLGDVNNDEIINAVDASIVLTHYAMISINQKSELSDTQKLSADVNKDGKIDAVDASCILSYYAYTSTTKDEIKKTLEEFLK